VSANDVLSLKGPLFKKSVHFNI